MEKEEENPVEGSESNENKKEEITTNGEVGEESEDHEEEVMM